MEIRREGGTQENYIHKENSTSQSDELWADKSPGPDELHPRALNEIVDALVLIFQNSPDLFL